MRISHAHIRALDLPFRKPFKHAAAERQSSDSIMLECVAEDGSSGFGECLPRDYVTGETRDGAFAMLQNRILPRLIGKTFESLQDVRAFLESCDGQAPRAWVPADEPQTAAWCSVDLALLDLAGRVAERAVRLTDRQELPADVRYSAVIPSNAGLPTLLEVRLVGIRQVKLKIEPGFEMAAVRRARRWLGRRCDLRVDANMAWTVEEALTAMAAMASAGVHSFEQPLPAGDLDGLARLVAQSGEDVMADESVHSRASLVQLIDRKACTAVNVRISKCGGLVAAHRRCREALEAGLFVQLGCQVGESSLLSAAHLILMTAVQPVRYAEGCFGRRLLREDPAAPVLQFGLGGRPPVPPAGPGLGVTIDPDILDRWTSRRATVGA